MPTAPIARAVGAMVISPTPFECCCGGKESTHTGSNSRKCQTAAATPAKTGVLPLANRGGSELASERDSGQPTLDYANDEDQSWGPRSRNIQSRGEGEAPGFMLRGPAMALVGVVNLYRKETKVASASNLPFVEKMN